jgi:hypothetical protein
MDALQKFFSDWTGIPFGDNETPAVQAGNKDGPNKAEESTDTYGGRK